MFVLFFSVNDHMIICFYQNVLGKKVYVGVKKSKKNFINNLYPKWMHRFYVRFYGITVLQRYPLYKYDLRYFMIVFCDMNLCTFSRFPHCSSPM